ncbi:rhodanese-like domain-containing protein [Candidatus Nanohalococcus occultus]|uniref:Rhodanese-related sulfurtransferase n=1 Tax=Candidatus Nanohalococcus occultus TaxID=2978047 RepID=A0ABY8CEQ4_9ARCH|nr:Rhodanese-related sulfurtransferase [Candidatus Nanohaloarchaeota archaeon SVXNc]
MTDTITTTELENRIEGKCVIIDVLAKDHFREAHLPGAINIPLEKIGKTALERFDKDQELVVYCKDRECSASPKAAEKLEKLGFNQVKDYEPGLEGWKKAGNQVSSSEP